MTAAAVSPTPESASDRLASVHRYRRLSNIGVAIAMISNVVAFLLTIQQMPSLNYLGGVLFVLAVPAWFYGLAYYAKAKGRSFGWAALGCISFTDLIILVFLPDLNKPRNSKMPWTRNIILGLVIFMLLYGSLVIYMASRTRSATPEPIKSLTHHHKAWTNS